MQLVSVLRNEVLHVLVCAKGEWGLDDVLVHQDTRLVRGVLHLHTLLANLGSETWVRYPSIWRPYAKT